MKSFDLKEVLKTKAPSEANGSRNGHFWDMHPYEGGATWIGKWQGESPWERHTKGDEFLHVLEGTVEVQIITETGKRSIMVPQGNVFVVPRNHWHRQIAREQVIVLGATPGITDHCDNEPTTFEGL